MSAYADIDAVNFSTLKAMAISPLRYRHVLAQPRHDTDPMRVGRLQHCAILQPDLAALWPRFDGARRAGKEWSAFLDAHGGDYHKGDEYSVAAAMADAVRAHPVAGSLLVGGTPETPVTWSDARTGVRCKCRPDLRHPRHVVEIKTTGLSLSPRMIQRQIAGLLYHAQAAFYLDACGADTFTWIFVEQAPPHDVAVVPANSAMLARGREMYSGWLDLLVSCRASDVWPGVAPEPLDIDLPEWAMGGCDDPGLDLSGLEAA